MASTQAQREIHIPCEVSNGAFPGELLVTFETQRGPISGFVRDSAVQYTSAHNPYLIGVVEAEEDDTVIVRLRGSFFRTTGIAYFRKDQLFDYA